MHPSGLPTSTHAMEEKLSSILVQIILLLRKPVISSRDSSENPNLLSFGRRILRWHKLKADCKSHT